jgi:hypothetical protein
MTSSTRNKRGRGLFPADEAANLGSVIRSNTSNRRDYGFSMHSGHLSISWATPLGAATTAQVVTSVRARIIPPLSNSLAMLEPQFVDYRRLNHSSLWSELGSH